MRRATLNTMSNPCKTCGKYVQKNCGVVIDNEYTYCADCAPEPETPANAAEAIRNSPLTKAKEIIRRKLVSDDKWLIRGLLAIYECQTSDEQRSDATIEWNEIGFNGVDAEILSSFAKQVINWAPGRFATPLSFKQMEILRKKMPKYAGQLARIAQQSQPVVA